jgi:hypothetical protein
MKARLVSLVGILCIAFSASVADAKPKPDKPGKPPRPGNIAAECIEFTGPDLQGKQVVEGCCPNAGPFPAYTMTVDLGVAGIYDEARAGYLFAKPVTTRVKGQKTVRYKVQFWTWNSDNDETPGDGDYFIEVYADGDDIDETENVLTVTFNNDHGDDTATVWICHDDGCATEILIPSVDFEMIRTSDLTDCPVIE